MYYHAALLPQMDAYFLEQVEYGYIYSVREWYYCLFDGDMSTETWVGGYFFMGGKDNVLYWVADQVVSKSRSLKI